MSSSQRIPWKRISVESAAIVASILLAFAIDAWWEERGQRAKEESYIAGLVQDFESHQTLLEKHRQFYRRRLETAEQLMEAMDSSEMPGEFDVARAIGIIGFGNRINIPAGTLDTVLANDGLSLFQDDRLRAELANWIELVSGIDEVNEYLIAEGNVYLDYLRPRYSIRDIDRAADGNELPPSAIKADVQLILEDIEFANAVYQQWYASSVMLSRIEVLTQSCAKTLAVLNNIKLRF